MEKNSEDLKKLLIGLCSSDEDNKILEELCNNVVNFTESSVEFGEGFEFNYEKGNNTEIDKNTNRYFFV